MRIEAVCGQTNRGPQDRPHLHLVDLGVQDSEATAAQTEHRIGLAERTYRPQEYLALLKLLAVAAGCPKLNDFGQQLFVPRQELVEWRIEKPNDDWQPSHGLQNLVEITFLDREQLVESRAVALPRALQRMFRLSQLTLG